MDLTPFVRDLLKQVLSVVTRCVDTGIYPKEQDLLEPIKLALQAAYEAGRNEAVGEEEICEH